MIDIERANPTAKKILNSLDIFEEFCMGEKHYSPSQFRKINKELSIGAVLMLGKFRYKNGPTGKRIFWKGLDNREHDLGLTHDANIMRDYPGFNAKHSNSLAKDSVIESQIISIPNGKGNFSAVTLEDGSTGIGPNYRIALRNAALKMHLKSGFNPLATLDNFWKMMCSDIKSPLNYNTKH